jgi:uncharacterized membrane protein
MGAGILAFGMPGGWEWIVIMVLFFGFFIIPMCCLIGVILWVRKNRMENQRPRMEVGKLADEVEKSNKAEEQSQ